MGGGDHVLGYYEPYWTEPNELEHFGVKGMKWGVRRYQNADGTLTEAGKKARQKSIKKLQKYTDAMDKYRRENYRENQIAAYAMNEGNRDLAAYSMNKANSALRYSKQYEKAGTKYLNKMKKKFGETVLDDVDEEFFIQTELMSKGYYSPRSRRKA